MWKRGEYASYWNTAHSLSGEFFLTAKVVPYHQALSSGSQAGEDHFWGQWMPATSLWFGHRLALFSIPFHCPPSIHLNSSHIHSNRRTYSPTVTVELSILSFHPSSPLVGPTVQNFTEYNCHVSLSLIFRGTMDV